MYIVKVTLNKSVVYALSYKNKSSANKRFEKAKNSFIGEGWGVELLNVPNNTSIFEIYGL